MLSLSPVDDPIRSALDAQVLHFSKLVAFASIAVAVGIALEGIEIIHDAVTGWKRRKRKKVERIELEELSELFPVGELVQPTNSHSEEPKWVKRILRAGLIIVVIGAVAEWRYGAKLEDAHNAVHLYDLGKIAAAEKQAGDAAVSAKTAHDEAGAAGIEARQAETTTRRAQDRVDAVTEQSDQLERRIWQIQYLMSGRTLIDMDSFTGTLKKFKGNEIVLSSFASDAEAYSLCNTFVNAAFNAEMKPVDHCAKESPTPPLLTGILVSGPNDDEINEFANIVAYAVTSGGAGAMHAQPGSTLTIRIGSASPFIMDKNQFFHPPPVRKQPQKQNKKP
jgi:hypothetical protein